MMLCITTKSLVPLIVLDDKENVVAGWNDIVKDKHGAARAAFID